MIISFQPNKPQNNIDERVRVTVFTHIQTSERILNFLILRK